METVDEVILDKANQFMEKAVANGERFFCYLNPTRMHVVTNLSEKYQKMRTGENGWTVYEAGMKQLDDIVGGALQKLKDLGIDDNTIVVFTTDNGAENFTWPDGGQTPFAGGKGTVLEGGFRVPCIVRWPGKVPSGVIENGLMSGLDWFPTILAASWNTSVVEDLRKGTILNGKNYKVHLDGYNQMDLITGKGPSKRKEIIYFAEATLGAIRVGDFKYRFSDQPGGWLGGTVKPDMPIITNLRLDPFERSGVASSLSYYNWFVYQFWRFVFVQEVAEKFAQSIAEFPPLQAPASFNLDSIKEELSKKAAPHHGV
jgi:arylsulfatase